MTQIDKEQSQQRYMEIKELWCQWDPIGTMGLGERTTYEYENFLGPTLRLLQEGASNQCLAEYLSFIVGKQLKLGESGISCSKPLLFAEKLRSWYESRWSDISSLG